METPITVENFNEFVLQSPIPVLMDCWAPWCGPCQLIAPLVTEIADEYAGRIAVAKFNLDEGKNGEIAAEYNIMSLPTLKLFSNGQAVDEIVGAVRKEMIIAMIEKQLTNFTKKSNLPHNIKPLYSTYCSEARTSGEENEGILFYCIWIYLLLLASRIFITAVGIAGTTSICRAIICRIVSIWPSTTTITNSVTARAGT